MSRLLPLLLIVLVSAGCATSRLSKTPPTRGFDPYKDTFNYTNELAWEYRFDDASGRTSKSWNQPKPAYTLHCFAMARASRQFFQHARFDPALPRADEATYHRLIRQVIWRSPRRGSAERVKVVIPGFADLRSFSAAWEKKLKQLSGGVWYSYVQRGHWRMVFPISRRHQERTADRLTRRLEDSVPPVLHLVRFPRMTINHVLVAFDARHEDASIQFSTYDPNTPGKVLVLEYDRSSRTFVMPRTAYFVGGRVDVYEVYRNLCF